MTLPNARWIGFLLLLYPLLFWWLAPRVDLLWLAVVLCVVLLLRLHSLQIATKWRWWGSLAVGGLFVAILGLSIGDSGESAARAALLKSYPVVINGILLAYCCYTLFHPPSAIERFATAMGMVAEPEYQEPVRSYLRVVTMSWCVFFVCNGVVSGYMAMAQPNGIWALYTGVVSYVFAGLLFGIEYLVRIIFRKRLIAANIADGAA